MQQYILSQQNRGTGTKQNLDMSKFVDKKVPTQVPQQQFNPYVDNKGSIIAVGGPGFVVVGCDTRLSQGYSVRSRDTSKIQRLTDNTYLASSGMYTDFCALKKKLGQRIVQYNFKQQKQPNTHAVAALLSYQLYMKRFFPFYTFNLLCGLNENGDGVVYGYDAIGSYQEVGYGCQGSGKELVMPVLDNILLGYNKVKNDFVRTKESVRELIIDCFNAAAERDIATVIEIGDQIQLVILENGKEPVTEYSPLRRD